MPRSKPLAILLEMLTYARPAGSLTETVFIAKYISGLPGAYEDTCGNYHVEIGDSPILWSCHTDTVHRTAGRQTLHLDPLSGIVQLSKRSSKLMSCLGADDTAGVFLCTQLIARGVPGHYVFHYGEEIGGVGSSALAHLAPAVLGAYKYAIALDRAGTADVITHQMCGRTASTAFAESLAQQLNASIATFAYRPCPNGTYTDTAEYASIIPECSNLSIGYQFAHTSRECLDTDHVLRLLDALSAIDASRLVCERDPAAVDPLDRWSLIFGHSDHTTTASLVLDWPDECTYCGKEIDASASDAHNFHEYCSRVCELESEIGRAGLTDVRSVYLDPEYEDVVRALHEDSIQRLKRGSGRTS